MASNKAAAHSKASAYTACQIDAMIEQLQAHREQAQESPGIEHEYEESMHVDVAAPFNFEGLHIPMASMPIDEEFPLPTGVTDMDMWARTMVSWGKAARGSTFEEIWEGKTEQTANYRKWVFSQRVFVHSYLTDLQLYLRRRRRETSAKLLVYPGSQVPRIIKPASDPNKKETKSQATGSAFNK